MVQFKKYNQYYFENWKYHYHKKKKESKKIEIINLLETIFVSMNKLIIVGHRS